MSFNKIIVVGNLGADPELRHTPDGMAVCNFNLATNQKVKNEDITTWFKITVWGKQAENAAKYLRKGNPVYIDGRLNVEEWEDRDGKARFTLVVNANDMHFLGTGERSESGDSTPSSSIPRGTPAPNQDDDGDEPPF